MKKTYFLLGALCATFSAMAQPILNSTDINPTVGESMSMIQGNYISEGSGGNNVTWDLSATTNNMAYNLSVSAATATTPNANIDLNYGGQSHMYQLNNAAGQQIHNQLAGTTMITFSDPMQYISFPFSMSTSYIDDFTATFTSSGYSFVRQGTIECEGDGYGTLITPSGTFTNVLRATITQLYTDTYSLGTIDYEVTSVVWYKAGYHNALATCVTLNTFQGTQQYTEYMVTTPLGLDAKDLSENVNIFPNPVENSVFIDSQDAQIKSYELYNVQGELIYSSNENLIAVNEIDMRSFNKGIYILKLTATNNSVVTKRIVKK